MAAATGEGAAKEEPKTQFALREGVYRLMTLSEYTRPNRVGYNGQASAPVKVSFITLNDKHGTEDRICFNLGRELYFYQYKGVRKAADLTKPIDKRVYKGTLPTCHNFNQLTASAEGVLLLVGFTAGQVQLIDPIRKEPGRLYNEERQIDKSKVTCIQWIPGSPNQFLVAHSSGNLYVYNEELTCGTTSPSYQLFKQGDGFSVHTCKTKSTRNPLYRWLIGDGGINEFAFSPCSKYLAVVSQDGYLRVINYDAMELVGVMKSYFGGLICVCWSPDGKYIVTGGEDDLVTVWSFNEKRVVCRGQGHKSWVNVVAFDAFTTSVPNEGDDCVDMCGSDEDFNRHEPLQRTSLRSTTSQGSLNSSLVSYRFGSVSQDTQLCMWDLTEEVLRQPMGRLRTSTIISQNASSGAAAASKNHHSKANDAKNDHATVNHSSAGGSTSGNSFTQKFATLALGDHRHKDHEKSSSSSSTGHKRTISLGPNKSDKLPMLKTNCVKPMDESLRLLGTASCPRLDEVPLLEPLVCKKIAHERLNALVFREECLVTACQEGFVCTWARPGKVVSLSLVRYLQ
ncbi:hypothetical protein CAPTEDRAFT_6102 [Capitella teleta]|uniref:Uncharacterized protein n=1 Tax=Capitella teleta TaxID=283909 RepID=R7V4A2_CAPTE|nr:hypothetical protein CAPTEDRAFT_6102 [Capitella teleta]|eukprot:ELU10635.1 hypothetical protein CAPTEDRAFT_6102 [Capitella teleta]